MTSRSRQAREPPRFVDLKFSACNFSVSRRNPLLTSRYYWGDLLTRLKPCRGVHDPIELSVQQRIPCAYCTHVPCRKRVLQLYCKLIRIKGLNRIFSTRK